MVIPNHHAAGTGGATAKSANIDSAMRPATPATATPRDRFIRSATQPSAGSCTTSKSLSPNSTAPSVARLTP